MQRIYAALFSRWPVLGIICKMWFNENVNDILRLYVILHKINVWRRQGDGNQKVCTKKMATTNSNRCYCSADSSRVERIQTNHYKAGDVLKEWAARMLSSTEYQMLQNACRSHLKLIFTKTKGQLDEIFRVSSIDNEERWFFLFWSEIIVYPDQSHYDSIILL